MSEQSASPRPRSLLDKGQRHAAVFISFAKENVDRAEHYRDLLFNAGFHVFAFHRDLRTGAPIESEVREQVEKCDYFLFLVSSHSASPERPWVARELGLALATQTTGEGRPVIIPILCTDAFSREGKLQFQEFPVRDFDSGAMQPGFSISVRAHAPEANPATDKDEQLLASMLPQMLLVGEDIATDEQLYATGVFDLYQSVFPKDEQELPENIAAWIFRRDTGERFRLKHAVRSVDRSIRERLLGGANVYQAMSNFFVLMLYGTAIGFAYLTYRPRSRLVYGSYICIREDWRAGNWAGYFIAHIERIMTARYPSCIGVVFEVEPIAELDIVRSLTVLEARMTSEQDVTEALKMMRRLKRILWYESIGARLFWDPQERAPLVHTYPCMDPDILESDWPSAEVDYWLMFLPSKAFVDGKHAAHALWRLGVHESLVEGLAKPMSLEYPDKAEHYYRYISDIYKRCVAVQSDAVLAPRFRFRERQIAARLTRLTRKYKLAI